MARGKKAETVLTPEERLAQALVPTEEQPYPVPGNWCWTTLNHVANWGSGGTPSRKNPSYYEGTIPWIKTGELDDDYIFQTEEHISEEALAHSSAKIFPINTIVIAMYGATIGKVGIMGMNASTNQACACGVCSPAINYQYLFYYACSQKDSFILKAKGGAQPNISQEIIKTHSVPLPPLPEQQRIVDRIESLFAKLDEAKEKAQAVVDGFEIRKVAILHKAFTGELTARWRRENSISKSEWENRRLSQISTIISGYAFSSNDFNHQNAIPCIRITNVGVGDYISAEYEFLPKSFLTEYSRFVVNAGDILISLTRSYINAGLKVCICREEQQSLLNQRVAMIKDCNVGYVYYYLRSDEVLSYVKEKSKTTNQPNLSIKDLNNLAIPVAPAEEQKEIVRILDSLFAKGQQAKDAAEVVIDQIDTMKKAILARAFRGELGTNNPAEEWAGELVREALKSEVPKQPRAKAVFIPKELEMQLESALERKIIKLYFKHDSETLAIGVLMTVSSKNFEVMDALRNLEQRGIIKKISNGNYNLMR